MFIEELSKRTCTKAEARKLFEHYTDVQQFLLRTGNVFVWSPNTDFQELEVSDLLYFYKFKEEIVIRYYYGSSGRTEASTKKNANGNHKRFSEASTVKSQYEIELEKLLQNKANLILQIQELRAKLKETESKITTFICAHKS